MVKKNISHFSIKQICDSGQCFRMSPVTEVYNGNIANEINTESEVVEVIARGHYLTVVQNGTEVCFDCSEEDYENIWKKYFDIDSDTDYDKIIKSIDREDNYLKNAAVYGDGIRILNQDLFEMVISFIISQRNNIKRIRGCIAKLCERYGEKRTDGQSVFYDFPSAEVLAAAELEDLKALGVGYRDVYIKKAAEAVVRGDIDLEAVSEMNYANAKEELLKLYGVGEKVADCICLFALHHTEAFPKDTHIISIVDNEYNGSFPFEKYEGYAGVLQQYMFFYDLRK